MIKILHFADAHIDMANFGRHDPETGLPMRVMDFLKSLDEIIDTAIEEKVDMVLFAGDTYKDRSPAPTFQREWGRRIMRLSRARIPTLLLTGNHDVSPSRSRAHAIQEFDTLEVPFVHVVSKPSLLHPQDLDGLSLQVIALPWVSRSGMMASLGISTENPVKIYEELELRLTQFIQSCLEDDINPNLPVVLTAHASIAGAKYGNERTVMLGKDLILPPALVRDQRLDYVAMGHIHKAQDLNEGKQPPVVYPGSIERVDFGEAGDDKFFVIANIEKGKTEVEWRQLKHIRPFIDLAVELENDKGVNEKIQGVFPKQAQLDGAIVRLVVTYPRELETLIDETALRALAAPAFEFHFVRRLMISSRVRLPEGRETSSLSVLELLDIYWKASHVSVEEREKLAGLSKDIIDAVEGGSEP